MTLHYSDKICVVCETVHNRRGKTCSGVCASKLRRQGAGIINKCEWCNKSFPALHQSDRFCNGTHYADCVNCGKRFEITSIHRPASTCSGSCASALTHSEEAKSKRESSSMKKYGVKHPFQAAEVKAKIAANPKVQQTKYGSEGFKNTMLRKYGVENAFLLPNAVPGRISKPNLFWKEQLEAFTNTEWELEKVFAGVGSIDLYCEVNGVKLAIEISPTATHNKYKHLIACNRRGCVEFPCVEHGKGRTYHQNKVLALKELHGVTLITIFDWMDPNKLLNFVKAKLRLQANKIGARKCELRRITQAEANRFLEQYHLMGRSIKQTYCYGLFFEGELLQVQTFAKRKDDWEAKRLATHSDWVVVGGISRGTKQFIREAKPETIVAFSDLNIGHADFDSEFNSFQDREIMKPQLCWSKGERMILAKNAAFQSADRLIGVAPNSKESEYPEDWSNEQVFLAEGWLPVWDCGMIKEVWHNSSHGE